MAILPIVLWPDAWLSTLCEKIPAITDEIRGLAADMLETMYAAPGRGLAAPQVGVLKRLFVMDATWKDGPATPLVMVNPVIETWSDETAEMIEGCLSIPGIETPITRPVAIRLRWTGLDGQSHAAEFDGIKARIMLHEYDHLDGLVTFDRLPPELRDRFEGEYAA